MKMLVIQCTTCKKMYVVQFVNLDTNKQGIYYRQNIIRLILIQNAGNVHNCTYMHGHEHAAYSTVALRYTHSRLEATAILYVNSTP